MKKSAYPFFTVVLLIIFFNSLFAQDSTSTHKDSSYFKASIEYLSNSIYYGRKDSLITPYITPTITYHHKSGVYASGSLSYLVSKNANRIDLYTLEGGYEFSFSKKWTGSVYISKSFYNDSSTNVQSAIKGNGGISISYDLDWLQLNGGSDVLFADKADVSFNLGLSHAFYLGTDDKQWTITPTVTANASTLNFYEGYTNRRVGKAALRGTANGATVTSTTTITNGNTAMKLLDYEVTLPINYDTKNWGLSITPTIALPQNPIATNTLYTLKYRNGTRVNFGPYDSTPTSEKSLQTQFFVQLSAYIKF